MTHNIEVESGKQVKLPTAGKYCDRDIVVAGFGSNPADLQAKYNEGAQAQQAHFWGIFQNNGEPTNYYYKFSYTGWTNNNYKPQYSLVCTNATTAAMALFYSNTFITDTRVPIEVRGVNAQAMFYRSAVVTIRELIVHAGVTFSNTFFEAYDIENITISGTIGNDFDIHWAKKLTKASHESIMTALSTTATGKTVTLPKAAVNKAFETSEGANDGSTSTEWKAWVNSRPNWTVTLA